MFEKIINLLDSGKNVFLTGGAGTGKSYLTREIIAHYRHAYKNIVVLGSTGISAVNIGGISVHSFFKFGISDNRLTLAALDKKQRGKLVELKKMLAKTDIIVIDEISMVSAELLEMIYERLLWAEFGGAMLFVGDFYQLPPVVRKSEQNAPSSLFAPLLYAFSGGAWEKFSPVCVLLEKPKRTSDARFFELLSRVRVGQMGSEVCEFLRSRLLPPPPDITVLYGTNANVDWLNERRLSALNSNLKILPAATEVADKTLTAAQLERWIKNINLPTQMKLKIGAKVMFVTNSWGEFYNGEQGIVRDIGEGLVTVEKSSGEVISVEPKVYELNDYANEGEKVVEKLRATFTQFPLKLAYAVTIHKSQGMSLERFVCNVDNIFANGQLYVALSRAMSAEGLYVGYSGAREFEAHLCRSVKIDPEVAEFYAKSEFIREKE